MDHKQASSQSNLLPKEANVGISLPMVASQTAVIAEVTLWRSDSSHSEGQPRLAIPSTTKTQRHVIKFLVTKH